ncbi:MAG TPA: hypothetical protein VI911_04325 [Patescibacteria group bacterium]|nr:hypothetical protein [Patescibacteria group bacterium]
MAQLAPPPATVPVPPAPGAPPAPAGTAPPPGPADVAASEQQRLEAVQGSLMDQSPVPTQAVPIRDVERVLEEVNGVLGKISDSLPAGYDAIRPIVWEPTKGEKTWSAALPPAIWLPLATLFIMAMQVEGGKYAPKHGFDPTTMKTPDDYQAVAAKLRVMANDKKFIEAVSADIGGGAGPEGSPARPAPAPEEAGGEDAMSRAAM